MKNRLCALSCGAYSLTATLWLLAASGSAVAQPRVASADKIIDTIETRLLPPILIEGQPPKTSTLKERMAALHVPGVSIAVIHKGEIAWARGFGVARVGGPPVTPETLFQAASISKPITALAVLRLAQTGKLDLDRDVNGYLKSWKLPTDPLTAQRAVTLRELLTHTAGVTVHGFEGYPADAPLPTLIQILNGRAPANSAPIRVDTTPGTIWRYSGGGYVIVQQLLEDVTGRPFSKLMDENVLAPLKMKHSTFEQPLATAKIKNAAMAYRADGVAVQGGPHVYPERAPAGLWTTPSDLALYIIEVQHAVAGLSNRVLTQAMAREMLTPTLNHQGLGPRVVNDVPRPYFQHTGSNAGYRCVLIGYEDGDGAVIMTNGDNGTMLFSELIGTIAHEYGWPDFQPTVQKAR